MPNCLIAWKVTQNSGGSKISQSGGANSRGGCVNLLFGKNLSLYEHEWNWTERGVPLALPLDLPLQNH